MATKTYFQTRRRAERDRRGRRHSPARAVLVDPHFHDSREAPQAAPRRSVHARRASRRHQRTLVLVDDSASNGPGTPDDEGLSYVRMQTGPRRLFKALVDEGGDILLGSSTMQREGGWNLLCKFFDNMGAIPHPSTGATFREAGPAEGQARGLLIPSPVQPD